MNKPFNHTPATSAPLSGSNAPASTAPAFGVGATFSADLILRDARSFAGCTTNEDELSYLANIAENLLRARPGIYAEECLKDFLSSLESALENEAEDRRWNGAERIEL